MRNFTFYFALAILLAACSSSRQAVTQVSHTSSDSITHQITDSARYTTAENAVSVQTHGDSLHATSKVSTSGETEERIDERITETVDADGTRTVTTDRTVMRKGNYRKDSLSEETRHRQEARFDSVTSRVDSLRVALSMLQENYTLAIDSLSSYREKSTVSPLSWWQRLVVQLKTFWVTLIGMLLVCAIIKYRNKQHEKERKG
nr:MAG TPA: TRAF PROTEIN, TRAO PROTEIN, TRAN ADHESION, BACTERIAL SECRETION.5A [Caudoviricetes sp.]